MLRKPLTAALLLAGAAGGPYVLLETDAGKQARSTATGLFSETAEPPAGIFTSVTNEAEQFHWGLTGNDPSVNPLNPEQHELAQPVVMQLHEVLRFDATPGWVLGRFPRVSTVLAEMQLDGLRTPLVTGTTPTDLAGTLTYYFDRYKRLQRISLHASTGDPTRFVAEMQQAFQLGQEPALGGGLYVVKWNGKPTSVMHVAPAPVIYADAPFNRFNVFIELNQPGLEYGLSSEAQRLISNGKQTQRW